MAERDNEKEAEVGREKHDSLLNPRDKDQENVESKEKLSSGDHEGDPRGIPPNNAAKEQSAHDRPCSSKCGDLNDKESKCTVESEENVKFGSTENGNSENLSKIQLSRKDGVEREEKTTDIETKISSVVKSDDLTGSFMEDDVSCERLSVKDKQSFDQNSSMVEDGLSRATVGGSKSSSEEEVTCTPECEQSNATKAGKEDKKGNLDGSKNESLKNEHEICDNHGGSQKKSDIKNVSLQNPLKDSNSKDYNNERTVQHESDLDDTKTQKEKLKEGENIGKDTYDSNLKQKADNILAKKTEISNIGGKSPTFDKLIEHNRKVVCDEQKKCEDFEMKKNSIKQISGNLVDESINNKSLKDYNINGMKDGRESIEKENCEKIVKAEIIEDENESKGIKENPKDKKDKSGGNEEEVIESKVKTKKEDSQLLKASKDDSSKIERNSTRSSRRKRNVQMDNKVRANEDSVRKDLKLNKPDSGKNSSGSDEESNDAKSDSLNVNGEKNSLKSDSSLEDSDKCSESEAAFTKRASNDPNFAVVYSFLSLFGGLLNLPECSLDELEQSLDNCNDLHLQAENHGLLEKLHLKLLRRLSRSSKTQFSSLGQVSNDRLLKNLIKFSKYIDLDLAWDLEKFGYHVLGSTERLLLLKALCEVHFDENPRFKVHFTDEYIKSDKIEALRLEPTGFDMKGKSFWFQKDNSAGFRIYSVEEDDDEGSSWKLLASTMEDFEQLIENLKKKSELNPKDVALMKRKERVEIRRAKKQETLAKKKGKGKSKAAKKRKDGSESDSDENDDNPCARCFSNKRPDLVLLCDKCDAAYHTLCLRPPLMSIPEGDWLCPYCQQLVLIDVLQEKHKDLASRRKAIERIAKRAVFDDIRLSNIVETGGEDDSRRSGRKRSKIDYNFQNYNEMITAAISNESSQPRSEISTRSFYGSRPHSSSRRTRKLNDLDDDSIGSGSSEYENSPSENEREGKEHEDLVSRGCRRSRRLKRKYGEDEKSESSESEDDTFVRRSTRRRRPTAKTYMEYESDDTPEEVLMKKSKIIEDNDEYVVSQSDEDPEDILRIRKRRTIISDDEDDDQETIEEDVETDFEDEELCADMEKNVVSDDSEEEAIPSLSEEEEPEENDSGETTTDDDEDDERYEEESNGSGKRKRSAKDAQEKKRGGKDMRTIMKSIREEEVCSSKKISKEEEEVEKVASIKEAEVKSEKENISSTTFACKESTQGEKSTHEEKHTESALNKEDTSDLTTHIISNEDKVECSEVADKTNMENKETIGANVEPSQGSTLTRL
ncbi:remodeling and spacing factor 1-like [Rhopilema esculentum]|uniref:remodeling and spacing factor 1-like n=1 Tax=Rhopilema esculentum TaxID=499914 RepID=UPI0031D861F9